jgi:hypothetical protein
MIEKNSTLFYLKRSHFSDNCPHLQLLFQTLIPFGSQFQSVFVIGDQCAKKSVLSWLATVRIYIQRRGLFEKKKKKKKKPLRNCCVDLIAFLRAAQVGKTSLVLALYSDAYEDKKVLPTCRLARLLVLNNALFCCSSCR